jgi:hypothetical protein
MWKEERTDPHTMTVRINWVAADGPHSEEHVLELEGVEFDLPHQAKSQPTRAGRSLAERKIDALVRREDLNLSRNTIRECWRRANADYQSAIAAFTDLPEKTAAFDRQELKGAGIEEVRAVARDKLADVRTSLAEIARTKDAVGYETCDPLDAGEYVQNPLRPVPNEPRGLDEEMRGEFRKLVAQMKSAARAVQEVETRMSAEMSSIDQTLREGSI